MEIFFTNYMFNRGLNKEFKNLGTKKTSNPTEKWGTTDLNRECSKEERQMAEKHLRNFSTCLVIRKIQIKVTLRFFFWPGKKAAINKTSDTCCQGCRIRGTLIYCLGWVSLPHPLWK